MRGVKAQGSKINLGCGEFPKEGFVNVDRFEGPGIDVVHDLSDLPWPFPDASADRIEADHVLEHLAEVFSVMREIHRVLRPGGVLVVRTPHFSRGFSHPEHQRGFDATFPMYFDPDFPGGYTGVEFTSASTRLRWFAQPDLKKSVLPGPLVWVGNTLSAVLDTAANLSPLVCSRVWCYWVGGFEEIEFVLRKAA